MKSSSRSIRSVIAFLTSTMQPKSAAKEITWSRSANAFPVTMLSIPECSCAARRSSVVLNRRRKTETARYRTACASWRNNGNFGPLILAAGIGRTSTAPRLSNTLKESSTGTSAGSKRRVWSMLRISPAVRLPLRILAAFMSAVLFGYLIWQAGPGRLWENAVKLGWGFIWVLAAAGISHVFKTWAWRLTLDDHKHKVSFPRLLGLRLGAEAAGQLGIVGQTFGDSIRVSHLSPEIRTTSGVASVTLDRGLYIVTGAMITIAGIVAELSVLSLSRTLRLYAGLFVAILIAFLLLTLLAVRKRWPVLSGSACIILRVPFLKSWMDKEYPLIQSVESTLFDFHHNLPKAFWTSFSLNLAGHCLAVLEVCLVLWLMKTKLGFVGALVVEAFTKIVNVVGNINPGNIGTYEGGNMMIGKMFGMNVATGLVLGLARRLRSLIWAAVGIICLFLLTRPRRWRDSEGGGSTAASAPNNQRAQADPVRSFQSDGEAAVVILIANEGTNSSEFEAPL